jgi:5-methylcytosine-specific restriction enzyme A
VVALKFHLTTQDNIMPVTPKKPCRKCKRVLTIETYCPVCGPVIEQRKKLSAGKYDSKRGNSAQRGYDADWLFIRSKKINKDSLCEVCLKSKKFIIATLVHHIKPIETHPQLRLTLSNLQSVCISCHEIIHKRRAAQWAS